MSSGETPSKPGTHVPLTYSNIVWQRLTRQKVAIIGLRAVATLLCIGIFAPLITCSQPLLWLDASGVSFPLLRGLFNRLLFENAVDLLFNLTLVASPLLLAVWLVPKARLSQRGRAWRGRALTLLAAGVLLLFVAATPRSFGSVKNPLYFTEPLRDYTTEVSLLAAQGQRVVALFPVRPFAYQNTDATHSLLPPDGNHWLGTDTEGRDVFARLIYGTRISLTIGIVGVAIYAFIGVVLGALAGYWGGTIDLLISRLIEIMICIPTFFLILAMAALIQERSIFHVMFIIGITSWTGVARLVRAEFLKNKNLEYVQAAIALGIPWRRIVFGHILPNAISPVLVSATFGIASAILIESSLAFLGVGDMTVASWGETLNAGRTQGKLWLVLAPGLAIFLVVCVFNLVGEGLRDALDPKIDT
jgi:peptide/nickel transport system permease protein